MTSKLIQRPGSSARVYDDENLDYANSGTKSRIPKMPKRTYSLEGKGSTFSNKRASSRQEISNTSMIPRLEWKKCCKRVSRTENHCRKRLNSKVENYLEIEKPKNSKITNDDLKEAYKKKPTKFVSQMSENEASLEEKINEDFTNFKSNVLRIPEYWTDAGQTVTNILKNAIHIVTKQYPSADVETFEKEIQNILKATDTVKERILTKTDKIINQASKIYSQKIESDEDLQITKKLEEVLNGVNVEKNAVGDWLECRGQLKQFVDLDKMLKLEESDCKMSGQERKAEESVKRLNGKKSNMRIRSSVDTRRRERNVMHSCGDVLRKETRTSSGTLTSGNNTARSLEDKSSQTINLRTAELQRRDEILNSLNNQILELQQLCRDHISKFKSFNLQIKLRGICNKAQNLSASREIQILNEEKLQLADKNSKLQFYNKDLESTIKQKDLDLHQKDRLINQQKKLLFVRDELIEMLKNRCNIEDIGQL